MTKAKIRSIILSSLAKECLVCYTALSGSSSWLLIRAESRYGSKVKSKSVQVCPLSHISWKGKLGNHLKYCSVMNLKTNVFYVSGCWTWSHFLNPFLVITLSPERMLCAKCIVTALKLDKKCVASSMIE